MIDAPPTPHASVSPDRRYLLLQHLPSFPGIEEVAAPERRLAGLRIDPRTGGSSRRNFVVGLTLAAMADPDPMKNARSVAGLPKGARIADLSWAPDSNRFAFTLTGDDGAVTLWIVDARTARARRVSPQRLVGAGTASYGWLPDSRTFLARIVPKTRKGEPTPTVAPDGPIIQESTPGKKAPARTYQDLLKNPHDERLFEHYLTSQLCRMDLAGKITNIGQPTMIAAFDGSPDGKYIFVGILHRPYSYRVPYNRFPMRIEIWDMRGRLVKLVADLPLRDDVPVDFAAVPTGPRSFEWRADADATLVWVEALDGGDPKRAVEFRDEVKWLPAPFTGKPRSLLKLKLRYGGIHWGDTETALLNEWWWSDRKTRTYVFAPDVARIEPKILWDRSSEDRYDDPGDPVLTTTSRGTYVLAFVPGTRQIYLFGDGASPEGDRPFVDRLDLAGQTTERLWRSEAPHYETPWRVLDIAGGELLTRRESVAEPPQYVRRQLPDGPPQVLTRFPHPSPKLAAIEKRLIQYQRPDGVTLSGMLYLPPGWKAGVDAPLPLVMWAYPQEFKSSSSAGQVTDSPLRFARLNWATPLWALALGYAVLDGPTMPIVGEGKVEPNDSYITQLSASARAAVEEVVRLGVADRDRIAIGGHSYGAFMTANLLAHTDLFRAGIARSGAYNRTLTPFGFQSEERTFWDAPRTYIDMSPYAHADRIKAPLLIIHGEADNNPGTFPMQSERLFEALKGLGGTARFVMLPAESHGYRARESVMHTLWEMATWLDLHVKGAAARSSERTVATASDGVASAALAAAALDS